jgi:hypothetical protein
MLVCLADLSFESDKGAGSLLVALGRHISLSQDSFRKRAEIDFNFLDLVALDYQVLGIPKFGAGYPLTFITNKSFIPFFKELLDVKDADCLTIRPTPLKISRSTNVIIERTAKSEVVAQQIFQ